MNAVWRFSVHQFEKLQVEYIDFYMFHGINKEVFDEKILKFGLLDEMIRMKEAGKIRNLGFSFHGSYEDFAYILNYRDWDFCQIQYNYMDTDIQAGDRGVALAAERKVPLIIMEPVKGGSLASFAPAAEQIFKDYAPGKEPCFLGCTLGCRTSGASLWCSAACRRRNRYATIWILLITMCP